MRHYHFISPISYGEMISAYLSGESVVSIAKRFECDRKTVYRGLRGSDIVRHGRLRWARKYQVNESFFDHIDTEAKEYCFAR